MRASILQNIIEIQKEAAKISAIQFGRDGTLNWVLNSGGRWPNSIIGTAEPKQIPETMSKIDQQLLPPIWIMEKEAAVHQIEQLERNGFREINRWEGMWLNQNRYIRLTKVPDHYTLIEVQTSDLLNQWWSIVKPVMMPNREIPSELLKAWGVRNEYQLLIGQINGKPVSAGMAYLNNGIAGLYFIATLPEYRRRGYALLLIHRLVESSFERGANEIVLHSSADGQHLYRNVGFTAEGIISTYWKVGLF